MGSCVSIYSSSYAYKQIEEIESWGPFFSGTLKLSESDIGSLYKTFSKIAPTANKNNRVSFVHVEDLRDFLGVDHTPFTDRVLSMFDTRQKGTVNFREFVLTVWNYCTLEHSALAIFAFDLYDEEGRQQLGIEQLNYLFEDVYGAKFLSNKNAIWALEKIKTMDKKSKEQIGISKFAELCRNYPSLLQPAFDMQLRMKTKVVGRWFWTRHTKRRIRELNGKNPTKKDLLRMLHQHGVAAKSVRVAGSPTIRRAAEIPGTIHEHDPNLSTNAAVAPKDRAMSVRRVDNEVTTAASSLAASDTARSPMTPTAKPTLEPAFNGRKRSTAGLVAISPGKMSISSIGQAQGRSTPKGKPFDFSDTTSGDTVDLDGGDNRPNPMVTRRKSVTYINNNTPADRLELTGRRNSQALIQDMNAANDHQRLPLHSEAKETSLRISGQGASSPSKHRRSIIVDPGSALNIRASLQMNNDPTKAHLMNNNNSNSNSRGSDSPSKSRRISVHDSGGMTTMRTDTETSFRRHGAKEHHEGVMSRQQSQEERSFRAPASPSRQGSVMQTGRKKSNVGIPAI